MKTISIVIPMYNSERFIDKCLRSLIVSNIYRDSIDIVVVNDGSTDHSCEIVEKYIKQYPDMIQLVSKKNGGHGSAINTGVNYCKGKYFKVLDADDWVLTDGLERVIEKITDINADVVVTNYVTHNVITKADITHSMNMFVDMRWKMQEVLEHWANVKGVFCIHGLIYNLQYYKKINCKLPEKVFYDDAYFYTVISSYAENILLIQETVTVYRIGDISQSVSSENRVKRINQHESVIQAILNEKETIELYSTEAREYWLRKLETTICDFYVTTLLRFKNRKEGKVIALRMKDRISEQDVQLAMRLRKRYSIIYLLHILHMSDYQFEKLVSSTLYKRLRKA